MSRDGLLPWFSQTHPRFHTPHKATAVTGAMVALAGGLMPIHLAGELVSIGTLLAFVLVCIAVPILRITNPDQPRPFRVRAPWVVGLLGAAACIWVMSKLPGDTWLRLLGWLVAGIIIYAFYGRRHSKLAQTGK
jgi:APA family basic amino acid/polyamine antiporter